MKQCEICGRPGERHHIVFRSQAPYTKEVRLNHKDLCSEHHRGDNGPHKSREIDLKYKKELQKKLFQIFYKDYYSIEEISNLLEISDIGAYRIVKTLVIHEHGYEKVELIIRLMGGMLYVE